MFADFNFDNFPIVTVKFNGSINNDDEFISFLQKWENLYFEEKDFILIFDTINMGLPPLKYCFKMSAFIKTLRKKQNQYLKKSVIIVKNKKILNLVNIMFMIQPPVAPVFITKENITVILNKINNSENINVLKIYKPKKPFLPFL